MESWREVWRSPFFISFLKYLFFGSIILLVPIFIMQWIARRRKGKSKTPPEPLPLPDLPPLGERSRRILRYMLNYVMMKEGIEINQQENPVAYRRLYEAAMKAERDLMCQESTLVRIRHLIPHETDPVHFEATLYREIIQPGKKPQA